MLCYGDLVVYVGDSRQPSIISRVQPSFRFSRVCRLEADAVIEFEISLSRFGREDPFKVIAFCWVFQKMSSGNLRRNKIGLKTRLKCFWSRMLKWFWGSASDLRCEQFVTMHHKNVCAEEIENKQSSSLLGWFKCCVRIFFLRSFKALKLHKNWIDFNLFF